MPAPVTTWHVRRILQLEYETPEHIEVILNEIEGSGGTIVSLIPFTAGRGMDMDRASLGVQHGIYYSHLDIVYTTKL